MKREDLTQQIGVVLFQKGSDDIAAEVVKRSVPGSEHCEGPVTLKGGGESGRREGGVQGTEVARCGRDGGDVLSRTHCRIPRSRGVVVTCRECDKQPRKQGEARAPPNFKTPFHLYYSNFGPLTRPFVHIVSKVLLICWYTI